VQAKDRSQAGLRLPRQLDLDRGRAAARDDTDEIRRVDQPPVTGRGFDLALPRLVRDQLAGPTSSRPRTVTHAATQAEASWWSHQIGAGGGAGGTSTPATRTPSLVAKNREPVPRGRPTRSIQPSRVSLAT
jgi:hypothetical protein